MPTKSIRYIAPGVLLPNHTSLSNQPFREIGHQYPDAEYVQENADEMNLTTTNEDLERGATWMPIYLFPIDCSEDGSLVPASADEHPFNWPYQGGLPSYPCGLWIREADTQSYQPYEDETWLILPFALGLPGHASTTEGRPIEPASRLVLYQMRKNAFVEDHGTQLYLILESWAERVESGDWSVDGDGVVGGIEKFKEAGLSEELSVKYRVSHSW